MSIQWDYDNFIVCTHPQTLKNLACAVVCKNKLYVNCSEKELYLFKEITWSVKFRVRVYENLRWQISENFNFDEYFKEIKNGEPDRFLGYGPMGPCDQRKRFNHYLLTGSKIPDFIDRDYIDSIDLLPVKNTRICDIRELNFWGVIERKIENVLKKKEKIIIFQNYDLLVEQRNSLLLKLKLRLEEIFFYLLRNGGRL